MEPPAGGKRGEWGWKTTPRGKGVKQIPGGARGMNEIVRGTRYRNEEKKTKQKKRGRN